MKSRRSGFTIGEVMVVILVICLILATLIPILVNAQKLARDLTSQNNLKQFALALQNMEGALGTSPAQFGSYADSELGSIWYHMLPFMEQEYLHSSGPVKARETSVRSYLSPLDPTIFSNKDQLPFELSPESYSLAGGNPVPAWAASGSPHWGLCSYGTNWMVFGDQPKLMQVVIRDGFSQTGIIAEKYAITQTTSGEPRMGAGLWAYGWEPPASSHHWARETKQLKDPALVLKSPYNEPYWPRMGYTNKPGAVPGAWTGDQPWEFRNHLKPQFAPNPKDSDAFREQGFLPTSMNLLNADGSVTRLGSAISDKVYFQRICPDDGGSPDGND